MDAKTPASMKPMAEEKAAPAFVFRMSAQVGRDRSMEMTFGLPSDLTPTDMNAYVDKALSLIERQNNKGILEEVKSALEATKKNLATNREQRENSISNAKIDWELTARRGDFKLSGAQKAQIDNFDKTTKNLMEVVIPKFEKDIAELERKIAGE